MINYKKIPENAKLFRVEIITEVYVMAPDRRTAESVANSYEVKSNEEPQEVNATEIIPFKATIEDMIIDESMKNALLYFPHQVYEEGDYLYDDMIKELQGRFIREQNLMTVYDSDGNYKIDTVIDWDKVKVGDRLEIIEDISMNLHKGMIVTCMDIGLYNNNMIGISCNDTDPISLVLKSSLKPLN